MKRLPLLSAFGLLLALGCAREQPAPAADGTPAAGLHGQVTYGQGDCMPVINEALRSYQLYTGELYFIRKAELDQLGTGSLDQLKGASLHYPVLNGQLAVNPPADTYVVMPANLYLYTSANTVRLTSGQGVQQNFKFWKCLVY